MNPRARYLIDTLELLPHPEGGFYRRRFESKQAVGRPACSTIFFLLLEGSQSRWHQIDADEVWFYHEGGPLELLLAETPENLSTLRLGPVAEGCLPQQAVPAHAWQAARCLADYTLVSCSVSPAFEFAGFRLLSDDPVAQRQWRRLISEFPELL